jgi:hypothetical protein
MCNLYSNTSNQQAIRDLVRAMLKVDKTGNLPPMPAVFREVAEHGRRIHDPPLRTIAGDAVAASGPASIDRISGGPADRTDLVEEPR